jgi:hypothetical protein
MLRNGSHRQAERLRDWGIERGCWSGKKQETPDAMQIKLALTSRYGL